MTSEQEVYAEVDLSKLRTLPGGNRGDSVFLVGNSTTGVGLVVICLPIVIAIVYATIMPFVFTSWGEINLTAVTYVWLVLWGLLAAFTLVFGNSRHFYLWNLADRTITHLNSGETKPIELKVEVTEGIPHLELSDPLSAGWHLPTSASSLALTDPDSIPEIEVWRPSGLIESMRKSFTDAGTWWCILIPDFILLVLCFSASMLPFFVIIQFWLLGAWSLAVVISWMLEHREYRRWRNGELSA